MKKLLLLLAALPIAAFGGDGDITAGSCALEESSNTDWNTAIGAAAMYGANSSFFNAAYGHRAGELVRNCASNVFIGVRAGKNATNLYGSVGIGMDALRAPVNGTRTTDINGQVYVNEGNRHFRVSTASGGEAEIEYRNGALNVKGDLVIGGNIYLTNTVYTVADKTIGAFDLYVDANRGDDGDDGSFLYPKRTLQAALECVVSNDTTICVRAGRYTYPEWLKGGAGDYNSAPVVPYKTVIVGVDGAENTLIYRPDETPCWMFGSLEGPMVMKGFTFTGFSRGNPNRFYWGIINFIRFEDCVFRDTVASVSKPNGGNGSSIFEQCLFYRCRIENCEFSTISTDAYDYATVFMGCYLEDCYVSYTSPSACAMSVASGWRNSYLYCNRSRFPPKRTANGWVPDWTDGNFYNSTVLLGEQTQAGGIYYDPAEYYYNCLVGFPRNELFPLLGENSYAALYNVVSSMLGSDGRPTESVVANNPRLRFFGYKASGDIITKNAILDFTADAIINSIPDTASAETANALTNAATLLRANITQLRSSSASSLTHTLDLAREWYDENGTED